MAKRKPTLRFVLRGKQGTIRIRKTKSTIFKDQKKYGGKAFQQKVVPTKPKGLFRVVDSKRIIRKR